MDEDNVTGICWYLLLNYYNTKTEKSVITVAYNAFTIAKEQQALYQTWRYLALLPLFGTPDSKDIKHHMSATHVFHNAKALVATPTGFVKLRCFTHESKCWVCFH